MTPVRGDRRSRPLIAGAQLNPTAFLHVPRDCPRWLSAIAGTLPNWIGVVPVLSGQGWAKIVGGLIMLLFLPAVAKAAEATKAAADGAQPAAVAEPQTIEEMARTSPVR